MDQKVYIGNDPAGYRLKTIFVEYFKEYGIPYVDCGCDTDQDPEKNRYPFFAARVANAVSKGEARCGVLICGTGTGICMAANKFVGVRASLCTSTYMARMTRSHNNANILCLGGKTCGEWEAVDILEMFLNTEYDGGFHDGSVDLISEMEHSMSNGTLWLEEPRTIATGPQKDAAKCR